MASLTPSLERLAGAIASFPGLGRKSASRIAYYILNMSDSQATELINAINDARSYISRCTKCQNLSETEICPICADSKRDSSVICVVEDPKAAEAIEALHEYRGLYHVLHGVISPLDDIGPDDISIKELISRIDGSVKEVILATNPSTEGEATAMYIKMLLSPFGVKVTRLAYGLPVGASLEFADSVTLLRALEGRSDL
ncbi:MAG: recombination protein RecR [Clostridia bacterium]|jgi:recombination protein RecR|nr:recombination protein RecR [Clostridia bacterium]